MSPSSSGSSIALLIAAVAILPALIGNLLTWAKDLGESASRQRKIDEATKHVIFWETWTKAMGSSNLTEDERVRSIIRMRQIAWYIDKLQNTHPEFGFLNAQTNWLSRFLLIDRHLPQLAQVFRFNFWLYMGSAFFLAPIHHFVDPLFPGSPRMHPWPVLAHLSFISAWCFWFIFFQIFSLASRSVAVWIGNRHDRAPTAR